MLRVTLDKEYRVHRNFLEIAYGSLKESLYLVDFTYREGYFPSKEVYVKIKEQGSEIGAMLWGILRSMK
jgi:four helix bundle protein